jgi:hypothetical protein
MREDIHWKREQDEYLREIGAWDKIQKDPMASLGYKVRSQNPYNVINMGSEPDRAAFDYYGLYQYYPNANPPDENGYRGDGTLDVVTGLPPERYAKTTVHELGHVGSRNSMSDDDYSSRVTEGDEEVERRYADLLLWPPGHPGHEDAKRHLDRMYNGQDYMPDVMAYADRVGLDYRSAVKPKAEKKAKPPKPRPKPKNKKKKKKTLVDYFSNFDAPAEEFGQGTRKRLEGINRDIDADFTQMGIPISSGGMSYTPRLPPPQDDIFSGANSPFADPTYRR